MTLVGVLLVSVYVLVICTPALLTLWFGTPGINRIYQTGLAAALTAIMIIIIQPIAAARFKWLSHPFGLDIVLRFHRRMAIFAAVLILAHPILLAAGGLGIDLLISFDVPWYIWLGKLALLLVIINVLLSAFRKKIKLSFERWRLTHDFMALFILAAAFAHSYVAGSDLNNLLMRSLWIVLAITAFSVFIYHRIIRPSILRKKAWNVTNVQQETPNVWTIKLQPPQNEKTYPYKPGQFHFITLHRDPDLPHEEHHFTISSAPTQTDYVTSTIKAVGDFTETIKDTKPGDKASVHGAFGRFSSSFHPDDKDIVYIVGGIGITPVMSMIRAMHDHASKNQVLLLYANRHQSNIVFRDELARIESSGKPQLRVIHVISKPDQTWTGETGHIDREMLARYLGDVSKKAFYICAPSAMLKSVIADLKSMGVKDRQIHIEIYVLLD